MSIKYIQRKKINDHAWNRCIESSDNQRIYAMSWYLDAVTDGQWDALVYADYQIIMPLPFVRKFGLKIYTQPVFCQQTGVFWEGLIEQGMIDRFLQSIPNSFYELSLNAQTAHFINQFNLRYHPNYILKLNPNAEALLQKMSTNHKRNIRKAKKHEIEYRDILISDYILLKKSTDANLTKRTWYRLEVLLKELKDRNCLILRGAFYQGELVSAVAWVHDFQRLIYLQAAGNELGKQLAAAFGLINEVIFGEHENFDIIDFEGSLDEGVGRFYKGFGATNEAFPIVTGKSMKFLRKFRQ
jgi:hypothetical protein